ncbi:microsomal triglyceride transfer protein large subunit-like [Mizuhopecten yessoensis]|uniref:Microsomal triglyceride transfer protein large subunit n=1 Tax=Mizuhopecten yessoensis TaxID=6573 RepID=A0A210QV97_MIZYE|nr:microsomal triglyceride transfer protein large subunit-like [Mizuhopecten yessoensis]XP_021348861.1 microsomal triglyceride transfer protein large subunit-like [Mizuhopecten yessoensis]OWF52669.1 Microsomal triglyceride transfer protein large subunit [Mizuhopecten yessoensis]
MMTMWGTVDVKLLLLLALLTNQSISLSLENGKTYKYSYETTIYFNELNTPKVKQTQKDVGFRLTAELEVTPVFHASETQLLRLQITKASVSSASRSGLERNLMVLLKYPVYFELNGGSGVVGTIYGADSDSTFCSNLKKGVISLFQLRDSDGERQEIDVSGECDTTYMVSGNSVTKTKQNCKNLEIAGQFSNPNKMFGVTVTSTSIAKYQTGDGVIGSVSGMERHIVVLNAKPGVSTVVTSTQKLNLLSSIGGSKTVTASTVEEAVENINQAKGYKLGPMLIGSGSEIQHCIENCEKPIDVLGKVKDSLSSDKLSTAESGRAFLRLLRSFRGTGKNTIEEVLTSSDSYYIVPQLIDVAVAAQTPDSHNAMMDLVSFTTEGATEYQERLLLALAYTTHPDTAVLQYFLDMMVKPLPSERLHETVVLALGALVHTYCQDISRCGNQVIADYTKTVRDGLRACKDENCKLRYIRSMGNSGLTDFGSDLIEAAETSSSPMISISAIQAFRRFSEGSLTKNQKAALSRMFHQNNRHYDSSVRIAAADVLLRNKPSIAEVRNIMMSAVGDQKNHETSTYIIKRLVDLSETDSYIRSLFKQILSDPSLNNYVVFAQQGKSSAFSSYLMATREMNSSYGLYQENSGTGVMKRSAMVVDMASKFTKQPLLTFGLYAEGLAALLGDAEEGAEDAEATAGMTLTLMDVLLPSVEFFRGSGELMSAVWNAPSDPVSALQGNLLLQDHAQKFHLSNGLVVDLEVLGVASIDMSGSVSISLWYKTSQSLIKNSGALVVEGSMRLDSRVLKAGINMYAESEASIDFKTDVEFSEMPFKMCLRMSRPDVSFSQTVEKYERSKKIKKRYRAKQRRISSSPGVSYLINKKNSIQCTLIDLN